MNDIKHFVITSDDYLHLVKIYAYLFNKFWSKDKKVIVLGYKKPNFELPDNFNFISLGKQKGNSTNWAKPLRKYFEKINDKYISWQVEDTFICDYVRQNIYEDLLNILFENKIGRIGRIGLTTDVNKACEYFEIEKREKYNLIQVLQTSNYRVSGTLSIWNREYLLSFLEDGKSAWTFENNKKAKMDEWKILGTRFDFAVRTCCAVRSGACIKDEDRSEYLLKPLRFDRINEYKQNLDKESIQELIELGYITKDLIAIR